tara:strand:- start:151461 stop:152066 length:606 start_codon:yes stop_codon:yes gene_type:complete
MSNENHQLPHSPAAERNKSVILNQLRKFLETSKEVMEIGHGTGEHALYFAKELQHLNWYPYDTKDYNWILAEKIKENKIVNLKNPTPFLVDTNKILPNVDRKFDSLYCANVFHIMHAKEVEFLCGELHKFISDRIILYGPYKFNGDFTSQSNFEFDQSLKTRDPLMGIRDVEKVQEWLKEFQLKENIQMPANNNLLLFTRV